MQGGQLTAIDVGTQAAPGALLHLGYVYDEFGNTGTITETTTANVLSYDGQSRVTQAFGATFSYQPSGRFDHFVGLTFAYGTGQAAGSNRSPLHGVVSTAAGGAFAYDLAGNMVSRKTTSAAPVQTLVWSQANELLSVTTGATVESYRYDADGTRIYQESRTSGALSWQQFDYFPHYSVKVASGVTTPTKYYFFNGRRIAQMVGDGALTYLHGDHLGSTVLTTGVAGNQKYHAYGALRSGGVQSDYQFTGQEADSGTGLVYMQARYYDPVVGQFISPDTVVPDPTNVYAYNRYMYAYGNPLKLTDPSGHCATLEDGSPDMEGDSQCWQAAFSIFGAANSPYTSFAGDWRITPEQWLRDIAANPFFEADFLQPFADKYTAEHARGAGLPTDKVIWHEPPEQPISLPGLNLVRSVKKDYELCEDDFPLGCGRLLDSISVASSATAVACTATAIAPCAAGAAYIGRATAGVGFGLDVAAMVYGQGSLLSIGGDVTAEALGQTLGTRNGGTWGLAISIVEWILGRAGD